MKFLICVESKAGHGISLLTMQTIKRNWDNQLSLNNLNFKFPFLQYSRATLYQGNHASTSLYKLVWVHFCMYWLVTLMTPHNLIYSFIKS